MNYFEIDYGFLKELRRIARSNCPECRRKRSRNTTGSDKCGEVKLKRVNYVLCDGRYHSEMEHCRRCCRVCGRSTDTLDSCEEDQYSLMSRSYSRPAGHRSKSTRKPQRERNNSIQSNKSVSFLDSSNEEPIKDETHYTAKSFTNDLKRFLLRPSAPRLSLRDKFITSFKQELEATRKSPRLRAIKGLWKSY